jgi:uncharacterized protein (UPF0261 family)
MVKTIVLIGALDTKGHEFAFVKSLIEAQGLHTLTVDFGVMGSPAYEADITRDAVAQAGGAALEDIASGQHKDKAMQVMSKGLAVVVRRLYDEGRLSGVLGMGGTGGTSIATNAMRGLPIGVPKVMLSTVAGGDVSAYAGNSDIVFVPSIVDVAGINRISRTMYTLAAGAISGMVKLDVPAADDQKPLVAASMFGNTTAAVEKARGILESKGYEVLVFHATGTGGRMMESLIDAGFISASLDITTTELADYVCDGVFNAGGERCLAASRAGIPTVLVPGCVDMVNFDGIDTVPVQYRNRNLYQWNPNVTLMRTNADESRRIGELIANAANEARGPVAVLLPLKGVSMLDSEGNRFWDPEADRACFDAIRNNLHSGIPVYELNYNINDPEFAEHVSNTLLELIAYSAENTAARSAS